AQEVLPAGRSPHGPPRDALVPACPARPLPRRGVAGRAVRLPRVRRARPLGGWELAHRRNLVRSASAGVRSNPPEQPRVRGRTPPMGVNPNIAGRVYPPSPAYEVGREKIREFAE